MPSQQLGATMTATTLCPAEVRGKALLSPDVQLQDRHIGGAQCRLMIVYLSNLAGAHARRRHVGLRAGLPLRGPLCGLQRRGPLPEKRLQPGRPHVRILGMACMCHKTGQILVTSPLTPTWMPASSCYQVCRDTSAFREPCHRRRGRCCISRTENVVHARYENSNLLRAWPRREDIKLDITDWREEEEALKTRVALFRGPLAAPGGRAWRRLAAPRTSLTRCCPAHTCCQAACQFSVLPCCETCTPVPCSQTVYQQHAKHSS